MSGIDPGRPKIEEREASFLVKGDRILLDSGVEWLVVQVRPGESANRTWIRLERWHGSNSGHTVVRTISLPDTDLIRTRVKEEDR